MKFAVALLTVAAIIACTVALETCIEESWAEYKEKYNKNYPSDEEEIRHRDIYCENVSTINDHNERYERGEVSYKMGVNQFTDLSEEEFANWVGQGFRKP